MDQEDAVVAHVKRLDRRITRIGGAAVGLLAIGLFAGMAFQDPETVAVQNVVRTQRLELTNSEGNVVAVVSAVDADPEIVTAYHPNGVKEWQVRIRDNKYEGRYVRWSQNGIKVEEGDYDFGLRNGLWMGWYGQSNSPRSYHGTYADGKEVGDWTWWRLDGKPSMESTYRDGKLHGRYTEWHGTGDQKREEGFWEDGEKHGHWIYWYQNGQKRGEGEMRAGQLVGQWEFWNQDGSVDESLSGFYADGVKIR